MKLDDAQVGGQLLVGTGVYRAIKQGPERINGSAGIEGPVVMGAPLTFGDSEATLMVGPCLNDDPDNQTQQYQTLLYTTYLQKAKHLKIAYYFLLHVR